MTKCRAGLATGNRDLKIDVYGNVRYFIRNKNKIIDRYE